VIPCALTPALKRLATQYPVITVTGPRQSGSTFPDKPYVNLEWPDVMPVEIKSGETICTEWFKGLKIFLSKLPVAPRTSALVYGGSEQQRRSDTTVWSVYAVDEMLRESM